MQEALRDVPAHERATQVNLASGFVDSVGRHGDRPALVVDQETVTYDELAELAGRIAATVAREDRDGHDFVGVLGHRSLTAYAGVLGALLAGKAYVPLHPKFPLDRTATMRRLSDVRVVVVGPEGLETLRDLLPKLDEPVAFVLPTSEELPAWTGEFDRHRFLPAAELAPAAEPLTVPATGAGDHAYLLFTSGSTGEPKGVAVSHGNVRSYIEYVVDRYEVTEHDRLSQTFDLTFDLSVHDLFVAWERGACVCCVPEKAVMAPAKFVRDQELTLWFSVPSTAGRMHALRMLKPEVFPTLRVSLFCGEPLAGEYASAWQQAAPRSIVENLYGPTEATIAITHYRWDEGVSQEMCVNGIVPIGDPFPSQRVCIIDDAHRPVPAGQEGELCLGGSQVTGGYLNSPEKTASQFVRLADESDTVWYRTGDLVRRDDGGCLHYLGRIDHQVKIRGFRVELQEIEHVLRQAAAGATAVAVPWPVRHGSADGVVAFVQAPEATGTEPLLAACQEALPDYMVPRSIRFVDDLPLNSNGKIDRKQLAQWLQEE